MTVAIDVGRIFQTVGLVAIIAAAASAVIAALTLAVRHDVAAGVIDVLRYRHHSKRMPTEPTRKPKSRPTKESKGQSRGYRTILRARTAFATRNSAKPSTSSFHDVRDTLWSSGYRLADHGVERYSIALLEQYKIYVETADRLGARRGLTNITFLTLNSIIITAIGVYSLSRPHEVTWSAGFPLAVLMVQCLAWSWLVRNYRQLNAAKRTVVGAVEERLPASLSRAEWLALDERISRYRLVYHLENWIPLIFAASYLGLFVAVLVE